MSGPVDVAVVGAGAAGLWCAWRAAAAGLDVVLLEKTPRAGTKILASGGTRCNLTTTLDGAGAARLFGARGARFLAHAFRVLPPARVRERFAELGVPTVEAPLEKVFPASQRARDVRDALERAVGAAGARVRYGVRVVALARDGDGWRLDVEHGDAVRARRVVLAAGGRSYPRTGTTGDGYPWLAALGLAIVPTVPALVPLTSPEPWVRELAGVALQAAEVRHADADGAPLARRRRPVVFTHAGLSGPGAMDLAETIARRAERGAGSTLLVDLAPDVRPEELERWLVAVAARPGAQRLSRALAELAAERGTEAPARRLLARLAAQAGAREEDPRLSALSRSARRALIDALKGLAIPVDGTTGYEHAEVTAGGLDLGELDAGSCRVRQHENLYVIGELLDLQGPIGGLNFQSAFATAEVAAEHLLRTRPQN